MMSNPLSIQEWRGRLNIPAHVNDKAVADWRAQRLAVIRVIAIAYEAGYLIASPFNGDDDSGSDLHICRSRTLGAKRLGACLNIQVKSNRNAKRRQDGTFTWYIDSDDYDMLRVEHDLRYVLALVVFNPNIDWIKESDKDILLRSEPFFVHLLGQGAAANPKREPINFNQQNRLSSSALRSFVESPRR